MSRIGVGRPTSSAHSQGRSRARPANTAAERNEGPAVSPVESQPGLEVGKPDGHAGQPGPAPRGRAGVASPRRPLAGPHRPPATAACVRNGSVMPPPCPAMAGVHVPAPILDSPQEVRHGSEDPRPVAHQRPHPATLAAAEARSGRPRDPALRHASRAAHRAAGQGQGVELPAAQRDPGRLDGALRAVQEASLARRGSHLLPAPSAVRQARRGAERDHRPRSPSGSRAWAASPSATRVTPPS